MVCFTKKFNKRKNVLEIKKNSEKIRYEQYFEQL